MNRLNFAVSTSIKRVSGIQASPSPFAAAASRLARIPANARFYATKKEYYVDKDAQIGDYPNLPWIKAEEKTPYGWWDRQNRRNFGEVVHEHEDILGMQSNSVYYHPPWSKVLLQWVGFVSLLAGGAFLVYYIVPPPVAVPKFYPFNGLEKEMGGCKNRSLSDSIEIANSKL
ncbi:NADH dehydrogenase [ubiquinone] 1 beta subcomplex subunit 8, mitochondrial [Smittium culicis]|uniref:NADH dehydrogenase [ubiquinone] 1 beta subcomplex subunit 8, mitochondrial n=1 Tax=Smittium culicis TaxID=133412 RepID=A0A1R1XUQ2_9FUNG|nr:NADH dehydrogenase [ubiquinone] 1 beta subcomplex subunit 8, mitochondrial [Smittium culicis]